MNFMEVLISKATALSGCISMYFKAHVRHKIILQNEDSLAKDLVFFSKLYAVFTAFSASHSSLKR